MNLFTKRFGLVLAGVVGVGAIASLAMGASFALFSSTASPSSPNVFTAGTVTFGTGNTSNNSATCSEPNLAPGDSSQGYVDPTTHTNPGNGQYPTCQVQSKYVGSLDAYIGVSLSVTSTSNSAGIYYTNTNDGSNCEANSNTSMNYAYVCDYLPLTNGQTTGAQQEFEFNINGAAGPADQVVSSQLHTVCTNTGTEFTTSWSQTCTQTTTMPYLLGSAGPGLYQGEQIENLDYLLPAAAGNMYQGSTATVTESFNAVQCANNGATSYTQESGGTAIPQGNNTTYRNASCQAQGPAAWS